MMALAYRLGGRGGKPSWWSHFTVRLWGMAALDGAGPLAGGTGTPAQAVVAAHGALEGDGSPRWRGCQAGMRWSQSEGPHRRSPQRVTVHTNDHTAIQRQGMMSRGSWPVGSAPMTLSIAIWLTIDCPTVTPGHNVTLHIVTPWHAHVRRSGPLPNMQVGSDRLLLHRPHVSPTPCLL